MKKSYQKVILLAGLLMVVFSLWTTGTEANAKVPDGKTVDLGIDYLEDYFMELTRDETGVMDKKEVRIYNDECCLVRVAKEGSILLNPVIRKADFLLEVDGIKYYRLNK